MKTNATMIGLMAMMLAAAGYGQETLTYADLVKRLTDLERLATLPAGGEKCMQWSSWDRNSRYDTNSNTYVGWAVNGDGGGIIRREGTTSVIAEMQGPGCIWRIWSAKAEGGRVRIYLDGETNAAAVDLPFAGYFDRKCEPFTRTSLVYTAGLGLNNYTPIPYQKSCKIVADDKWGQYYHFTYGAFPPGTVVPTFKLPLSAEDAAALDEANRILGHCGADPAGQRKGEAVEQKDLTIPAGQVVAVATLSGARAITGLRVKIEGLTAPFDQAILRELTLQMTWDAEPEPAVWSPLGDFFGTAPGANRYRSLPLGITDDGVLYSYWYMPFGKKAKIEIGNDGRDERRLHVEVVHAPLTQPIGKLGRFHAKWHGDAFLPAEKERAIDWPMLKAGGSGRYVGVMLHVWNPKGEWWGEGDEKFFVDGEKFPSTFGTGSEDYFGYAWGHARCFFTPLHNQTFCAPACAGHVSVNRWHISDNVPFQTSFEGCIEKYFPNAKPTLYDCVAYWYAASGAEDLYKPVALKERTIRGAKTTGVIEAEGLTVVAVSGGRSQDQRAGYQASDGGQLAWTGAKQGDTLEVAIPALRHRVLVRVMKGPDQGIVQFKMNGRNLGAPLDLYAPEVTFAKEPVVLGECTLLATDQKLTVEIVGANEKSTGRNFGCDYVKIEVAD